MAFILLCLGESVRLFADSRVAAEHSKQDTGFTQFDFLVFIELTSTYSTNLATSQVTIFRKWHLIVGWGGVVCTVLFMTVVVSFC